MRTRASESCLKGLTYYLDNKYENIKPQLLTYGKSVKKDRLVPAAAARATEVVKSTIVRSMLFLVFNNQ